MAKRWPQAVHTASFHWRWLRLLRKQMPEKSFHTILPAYPYSKTPAGHLFNENERLWGIAQINHNYPHWPLVDLISFRKFVETLPKLYHVLHSATLSADDPNWVLRKNLSLLFSCTFITCKLFYVCISKHKLKWLVYEKKHFGNRDKKIFNLFSKYKENISCSLCSGASK